MNPFEGRGGGFERADAGDGVSAGDEVDLLSGKGGGFGQAGVGDGVSAGDKDVVVLGPDAGAEASAPNGEDLLHD